MAYLQEKPKLTIETFPEKRKTQHSSKSTISLQQLLDECSSRATLSPGGSLQIPKRSSSKDYSAVLLKSDPIVLDKPLPMAPSRTKSIKTSSWIHDILKSTDISENEAGSKEVEVALTPVAASAGFECAETLMLPNLKEVEEPAPTSSSLLSESSPNTSNAQDASTTAAWVSSLLDFSASPISPKFSPSAKTDDIDDFLKPVVSIYSQKTIAMLNPSSPTSDDKRNSNSLTDEGDKTIVSSPNLETLLLDQNLKEVEKTQGAHVISSESDLPEIPKAHSKTLPRAKAIKPQQQKHFVQPPKILPRTSSLDPEVKAEAHHKLQYNTYRRYLRDQQKRVEIPVEFK
jgi:hypothetical protein